MENLWPEIKHVLFRFAFLVVLVPIFAYGILLSIESLEKAWKTQNRVKKWYSIAMTLFFLAIALGGLR